MWTFHCKNAHVEFAWLHSLDLGLNTHLREKGPLILNKLPFPGKSEDETLKMCSPIQEKLKSQHRIRKKTVLDF